MHFRDLGRVDYKEAWQLQEKLFQATVDSKFANRQRKPEEQELTKNHLLFCEHYPAYTMGKSGKLENLLASEEELQQMGATFHKINRGGDITFHGPGQLVGYPILDLDHFYSDVHRYLRSLEEIFIKILADYGLKGERSLGETGVWLDVNKAGARKICALGVRASRWVTMHGWAFNVNTDLSYFDKIVPCGIRDKGVTSLEKELGQPVPMAEIAAKAKHYFEELFEVEFSEEEA